MILVGGVRTRVQSTWTLGYRMFSVQLCIISVLVQAQKCSHSAQSWCEELTVHVTKIKMRFKKAKIDRISKKAHFMGTLLKNRCTRKLEHAKQVDRPKLENSFLTAQLFNNAPCGHFALVTERRLTWWWICHDLSMWGCSWKWSTGLCRWFHSWFIKHAECKGIYTDVDKTGAF